MILGDADYSNGIVSCKDSILTNGICEIFKNGGTITKDILVCGPTLVNTIPVEHDLHVIGRLRDNINQFNIGDYTCGGDSDLYICMCNSSLCNAHLPTPMPTPAAPSTNQTPPLRCYVGNSLGDISGIELTHCQSNADVCVTSMLGRNSLSFCSIANAQQCQQTETECRVDINPFSPDEWTCCCNSSGCNYNLTASIHAIPPNESDFQCAVGYQLSQIEGYSTMSCRYPNTFAENKYCYAKKIGGTILKGCGHNLCAADGCVPTSVGDEEAIVCCCNTSKCNEGTVDFNDTTVSTSTASHLATSTETTMTTTTATATISTITTSTTATAAISTITTSSATTSTITTSSATTSTTTCAMPPQTTTTESKPTTSLSTTTTTDRFVVHFALIALILFVKV